MIDWFNSSFDARLTDWKNFREQIENESIEEKLKQTALFFSNTPYCNRSIDYYTPSTWPDPWELINSKIHCLSSISLMMYYTLKFVNVEVNLLLIDDGRDEYVVPYHSDTDSLLNYDFGIIEKLSDLNDIKIVDKIQF